jgi:hypothetical protein
MWDAAMRWIGDRLLDPRVRYSRSGYRLRALVQPLHGEDVIDSAVLLLAVNGIRGDVVEFGVFEGRSLRHLWHAHRWVEHLVVDEITPILRGVDPAPLRRCFWGFDSFEGLPEHAEQVDGQADWIAPGAFAASQESVRASLRRSRIPDEDVVLVPGWYEDSLSEEAAGERPEHIALAHVDCDLYSSCMECLEFLAPRLVDGSIVIFDDWWLHRGRSDKGEQRALTEFRSAHPELRFTELHRSTTVSFLVHRDS